MEERKQGTTIPLDYIRGLLVEQRCKCAITGMPLDPKEVNADHVIPVSREELSPSYQEDNIWLVHKKINAMKGSMTFEEFVEACREVIDHHSATCGLLEKIQNRKIRPIPKRDFDNWIRLNCDESGQPKTESGSEDH